MRYRAFLAIALVLSPLAALADPREDVVNGLARCAVLTDDRQWLDCYYGAAQPMRAQLGLTPAAQAQIQLLQQVQRAPAFGAPQPAARLPATITRATVRTGPPPMPKRAGLLDVWGGGDVVNNAPVKSYDVRRDGFTVTLPDGQVWEQTAADADKHPVSWHFDAATMRVTISQAAMHTFNLVLNDENTHYKVHRIH